MRAFVVAGVFAAVVLTSTAQAGALSFPQLEYTQPRDPLTGSNPAYAEKHHASADQLADARGAIEAALPAGTSRQDAESLLRAAGAHCRGLAADGTESCIYHDVQTIDEYLDHVNWTVRMDLAGDKVGSLAVDRIWQRD